MTHRGMGKIFELLLLFIIIYKKINEMTYMSRAIRRKHWLPHSLSGPRSPMAGEDSRQ